VPRQDGYRLEAAIPLPLVAAVGDQLRFDLRVRGDGEVWSWNDTTNGQDDDKSRLGVIELVNPIETAGGARGTPVIDGIEDAAWARAEEFSTDTWVLLEGPPATARVRVLWDEKHLYVFAKVSDALLSKASANPWEQDSVEIFVDQNNAKTTYYEADDGQYRVNYENAQSFAGAASAASFVTATRVVDGGYVVEAAITLDSANYAGRLIGFDVQVNNDGTGTGVRSSVATWSDETGRAYLDPSRFGVIRLHAGRTSQR
jgi:endo-1,4-beta-xylanase